MPNPFEDYWSLVHRRAAQEMQKVKWGSEMEAQSGGSSASFRGSDTPEYVSQIMAEHPVSFVSRYPDTVDELRGVHGLQSAFAESGEAVGDDTTKVEQAGVKEWIDGINTYNPYAYLFDQSWTSIGIYILAGLLVLGGFLMIALSTDTGKAAIKKGVEAAAA